MPKDGVERRDPMGTDGDMGTCDRCFEPLADPTAVYTEVNGVEKKEWVCPDCEPDAREDEVPVTDGGVAQSRAALVGREWRVRIAYTVDYEMTVTAGPHRDDAVEEADLRRMADDVEPFDRDMVHSEVEAVRDIYENDPEACDLVEWIDAPSAPSEETYWDDSRHFEEVDPDE